jgi:hypothetical protein
MRRISMFQIHLINAVLEWERRLEIEDERRKALRLEPYRELPNDVELIETGPQSAQISVSGLDKERQPVNPCCA